MLIRLQWRLVPRDARWFQAINFDRQLPLRWGRQESFGRLGRGGSANTQLKGLILAQNERWRRGLGMQVEREV